MNFCDSFGVVTSFQQMVQIIDGDYWVTYPNNLSHKLEEKPCILKRMTTPSTRSTRQIKAWEHKLQKNITMKTPQLYTNKRGPQIAEDLLCSTHMPIHVHIHVSSYKWLDENKKGLWWLKTLSPYNFPSTSQ